MRSENQRRRSKASGQIRISARRYRAISTAVEAYIHTYMHEKRTIPCHCPTSVRTCQTIVRDGMRIESQQGFWRTEP